MRFQTPVLAELAPLLAFVAMIILSYIVLSRPHYVIPGLLIGVPLTVDAYFNGVRFVLGYLTLLVGLFALLVVGSIISDYRHDRQAS